MNHDLKYELINGRYVIGYFDDTGWHFERYAENEEEAIRICQKKRRKSK